MRDDEIQTLFGYTAWANARILDAAARMPADAFTQAVLGPCQLHDTLRHILQAEVFWRCAWQGVEDASEGLPATFPTVGALRVRWEEETRALDRFLRVLDEAAARTRDRQASIVKRRRDGQAPNGMPYLFAVLQDLLHPAPARTHRVNVGPDRRGNERFGRRRRRREGGRAEPATSDAVWSHSPAPLPIVEGHPVWRAALTALAQVLTPENVNAWLATTRASRVTTRGTRGA